MNTVSSDTRFDMPIIQRQDWPAYGLIDDLRPTLQEWGRRGDKAAIATLVNITGSSPRPLGSEMAISSSGEVAGYVSGGCVEGAVAMEAYRVITSGEPVMLDYGAGSPILDIQLTCGGRIGVFVRAIPNLERYAERLHNASTGRRPLDIFINLQSGAHHFDEGKSLPVAPVATDADIFRKTYLPVPRVIVVGSDPITVALCQLAPHFGFEVGLLQPYGPANPPTGVRPFHYDPRPLNRALEDVPIDFLTAVYTLTHSMDDDHAILMRALRSRAFAVGALGSRRKIKERNERLADAGLNADELERLSAPAGVDIVARNPSEIALSILAEMIAKRPRVEDVAA